MRDFTVKTYKSLLQSFLKGGYEFQTTSRYVDSPKERTILLRHDVDILPQNSLITAQLEHDLGIFGTYYFRMTMGNDNAKFIKQISSLGHEIGYHYEDLTYAKRKLRTKSLQGAEIEKTLMEIGIKSFKNNLAKLRETIPIDTICMHGSPLSKIDNRELWKNFDYHDYGIKSDPYFDINFSSILYLTDTGRRWDGKNFSVRDKADGKINNDQNPYFGWKVKPVHGSLMNMNLDSDKFQSLFKFRSTFQIIEALKKDILPNKIVLTVHPQRWSDPGLNWVKELIFQNLKNIVKYQLIIIRG